MSCKRAAIQSLTSILEGVQATLEDLQADMRSVSHEIDMDREALVTEFLAAMQGQLDRDKEIFVRETLTDGIDEVIAELTKSQNYLGRLESVTKGSADIARKLEKTLWQKLMSVIKQTKWYKEHFPAQYEEEHRREEYEHTRMRPEMLYTKRFEEPEEIKIRNSSIKRKASMASVVEQLQGIYTRLLQLYEQFFSADSPILLNANMLLQRIRNVELREKDRTTKSALNDQAQMVENLFGTDTKPGRLIALGGRAFLMPALHAIQQAITKLQEPISQLNLVPDVGKDIEQYFQLKQQKEQQKLKDQQERERQWELKEQQKEKQYQESRRKLQELVERVIKNRTPEAKLLKTIERMGIKTRQQKRCKLVQRIASSS